MSDDFIWDESEWPNLEAARRSLGQEHDMNIDLDAGAAPSPERTIQLAETVPEIVRALNHATRHHEALRCPADADRLLRELATAAGGLPQLLGQVTSRLQRELDAGRIEMAAGAEYGDPAMALDVARMRLERAAGHFRRAQEALDAAAAVTSCMAAREGDDD